MQKQNFMLKEQLSQLRQILQMNKKALKSAIQQDPLAPQKHYQQTLQILNNENGKLTKNLAIANDNLYKLQYENNILKKVRQAAEEHQKQAIKSLKSKILQLMDQLEAKEMAINQLQKVKFKVEQNANVAVIYKQVIKPTQIAMQLDQKVRMLEDIIQKKNIELQQKKQKINSLIKLNLVKYANQMIKKSQQTEQIINMQQEIFMSESQYSDQYQDNIQKQTTNNIPKLDLKKSYALQKAIIKKQEEDYLKKPDNKLRHQLELARKKMAKQILQNSFLLKENTALRRLLSQQAAKNTLLIEANKKSESRNQQLRLVLQNKQGGCVVSTSSRDQSKQVSQNQKKTGQILIEQGAQQCGKYEQLMSIAKEVYLNQHRILQLMTQCNKFIKKQDSYSIS